MATNENEIFDRETLLDLTVNFIPLFMILYFTAVLLIINPWPDLGLFLFVVAIGLHVVPFVALAILTYISGKAIAGDEKTKTVFPPGQATVSGTSPLTEEEAQTDAESSSLASGSEEEGKPTAVEGETHNEDGAVDDPSELEAVESTDGDGKRSS
jgi:hypothetical protein